MATISRGQVANIAALVAAHRRRKFSSLAVMPVAATAATPQAADAGAPTPTSVSHGVVERPHISTSSSHAALDTHAPNAAAGSSHITTQETGEAA